MKGANNGVTSSEYNWMHGNAQPTFNKRIWWWWWWPPVGWVRTLFLFSPFVDQIHQIKLACVGLSIVCNALFDWRCLVASQRYLRSSYEVVQNRAKILMFLCHQISGEGVTHPNFWPNFINLGHHRTCAWQNCKVWWRSAKRPRRLGGEKQNNKKERRSKLQRYNRTAGGHNYSKRMTENRIFGQCMQPVSPAELFNRIEHFQSFKPVVVDVIHDMTLTS